MQHVHPPTMSGRDDRPYTILSVFSSFGVSPTVAMEDEVCSGVVVPGSLITAEAGFLRGHGSFLRSLPSQSNDHDDNDAQTALVAAAAGRVERVNRLISVRPIKSRYAGEVGDLVVGRISRVESKRWRACIGAQKDAVLLLSSVNLPGGVQRMRTHDDQLQMKTLFVEGDLISAELQAVGPDGVASLHTRSLKYGKLDGGQLLVVPSSLVKRLPQHYVSLQCGVDVLLGRNGYIWISRTLPSGAADGSGDEMDIAPTAETLQQQRLWHSQTAVAADERLRIARVRNSIYTLASRARSVCPQSISQLYERSIEMSLGVSDMLDPRVIDDMLEGVDA